MLNLARQLLDPFEFQTFLWSRLDRKSLGGNHIDLSVKIAHDQGNRFAVVTIGGIAQQAGSSVAATTNLFHVATLLSGLPA